MKVKLILIVLRFCSAADGGCLLRLSRRKAVLEMRLYG